MTKDFFGQPLKNKENIKVVEPEVHPEDFCQLCKHPNPCWYADNELFNKVNGSPYGIICPVCFQKKADELGISIIFKGIYMYKENDYEKLKALPLKEKLSLPDSELEGLINDIKIERDCLSEQLGTLENELTFRKNPECRPWDGKY